MNILKSFTWKIIFYYLLEQYLDAITFLSKNINTILEWWSCDVHINYMITGNIMFDFREGTSLPDLQLER